MGLFHGGVTWRTFRLLVSPATIVQVDREESLQIDGKRFVPDLVVRCRRTGNVILVVEVWHSHPVTAKKKAAFNSAGFPWIEVRSWHVLARHRRLPLPVLDWGGASLPTGPGQTDLFAVAGLADTHLHELDGVSSQAPGGPLWRACQIPGCEVLGLRNSARPPAFALKVSAAARLVAS